MFSSVDFVLFALFLLLSLLVGLYQNLFSFFSTQNSGGNHPKRTATSDFLDGGRQLPVLPVCLSLLTTFVSGIGLLSVPAEIYSHGSAMALFNFSNF
uniref:NADH dehydrogenase subunit 5 n=1 Tax=Globodera rostochiensis TaxID=31243 RepID=A0A914HI97_GLORO